MYCTLGDAPCLSVASGESRVTMCAASSDTSQQRAHYKMGGLWVHTCLNCSITGFSKYTVLDPSLLLPLHPLANESSVSEVK